MSSEVLLSHVRGCFVSSEVLLCFEKFQKKTQNRFKFEIYFYFFVRSFPNPGNRITSTFAINTNLFRRQILSRTFCLSIYKRDLCVRFFWISTHPDSGIRHCLTIFPFELVVAFLHASSNNCQTALLREFFFFPTPSPSPLLPKSWKFEIQNRIGNELAKFWENTNVI